MSNPITIDREFAAILPVLSTETLAELEASIAAEGCREPLIVWEYHGKCILLDGHNRHTICEAHNIPYKVTIKTAAEIPDRQAAIAWIIRNQLARRNLTEEQRMLFWGRLYNLGKPKQGGTGANQHGAQTGHDVRSAQRLADEYGISERTIRRAGEFAAAVERAKGIDPDIEQRIIRGEIDRGAVGAIAHLAGVLPEFKKGLALLWESAVHIGEELQYVKGQLPHGQQFEQWVSDNVPFGMQEAEVFMRCYARSVSLGRTPTIDEMSDLLWELLDLQGLAVPAGAY